MVDVPSWFLEQNPDFQWGDIVANPTITAPAPSTQTNNTQTQNRNTREDVTLDALTALYNAYPKTQYVDYSGFIDAFQPVLNDPSMYVPQQGLLQNTPTLADITLDPTIDAYSPFVTGLLQAYPQMEQDFQSSFAVDPNTYRNFETYRRLPFDKSYWENVVGGSGSGGDGLDLGGVAAAGTVASTIVGGGNNTSTGGTDIITVDGDDGTDGVDGTNTVTTVTLGNTGGTTTNTRGSNEVTGVELVASDSDTSGSDKVTKTGIDLVASDDSDISGSDKITKTGVDLTVGGTSSGLITGSDNVTTKTGVTDTDLNTSKENAINDLMTAADSAIRAGTISGADLDSTVDSILASTSIANVASNLSSALTSLGVEKVGVASTATGGTNLGSWTSNTIPISKVITAGGISGNIGGFTEVLPDFSVPIEGDIIGNTANAITEWLNNPLNEGLGTAGTGINDATQFTGAEAISLGGGLLSLASALDEATPSNVYGTVSGFGASGLLGEAMQTTFTQAWVAPLAVALFIGEKLQADPSNKTGFGQYDAATGETTSFGMEGDKFKEKNVEASTSIASAMGGAVGNITDAFGLTAKGDILAQTGNRDPLNITYGNQESEATTNDRLNYNTESGDIQSGDGIERWYYTNKDGFDGARLTSDLVHGTALLSLKAKANGEDSIDLANMTLPSRSADDVKNTYLSKGFDETAADALTSAARNASGATSELLGGLLLANTTNEANYLTPTERESLLGQGYTNEQLDTMLYGTTNDSLLAINELLANDKQAPLPSTEEILLKEQHEKELALQLAKKQNIIAD